MKFSANLSMLYTEHDFLDRFAAAAADGFGGVEFVSPYDDPPQVVAEAARASGLVVVLFNSPAGDWTAGERGCACQPGQQARFRAEIDRAIDYARALGCPRLHIMAGLVPEGVTPAEAEAVFIDNLGWAAERLAGAGVVGLIEPINPIDMPGYGLSRLDQAERVLAAVRHDNLRLQYDVYHMAMMGEDVVTQFMRLLPLIDHIQIADRPGRHEPGSGGIDFPAVFAAIRSSGYQGWVGAEYLPAAMTSMGLGWRERA
ncbi:hydroxypyruvate isomerase [Devosia subaequoris]|uniref:Hydroxypyruvate isomerase n=1 Tax=Devosia subaequoris TaxID=395930 RepID=A0A7W6NCE4_9HYPH|nr:TIM barrel protein [Devosia subaequoris]MBB4052646.1 hydroxypyruvate isomerase [Devosia subaequoris]MCP1209802.1 TIM barrel protein [Devosia subaequoris]